MTAAPSVWTARLTVALGEARRAARLAEALGPESRREVPRASAAVDRPGPGTVELLVRARDSGAMRAALNTYLGWIHLALETERAGRAPEVEPGA
ncbi:MAG TPA: KEOPS complex subunit Pcc1 [Thermoplasmata archaeon]|nr:KEOPS complex subunit Pcc1 [Thermoplasmata archaeon]